MKSFGLALGLVTGALAAPLEERASTWSGWKGVKNLFVFGDSYTQTGFDPKSTQPSATNPFGNPTWPGWTSSNGPNWVGFLTATYNTTKIKTYNMAYGGATVDSALVKPYADTVLSLKNQVQDQFLPIYGKHPTSAPWKDSDSLFAFWIGINDVGNSWWLANATALYDQIFTVYDGLLESIYATGARNFLFLSVPPINKAPLTLANGDYAIENEGKMIEVWNSKLANLTSAFSKRHSNKPKIFVHDTHALFTQVINNPKSFEQTAGLKNVTGYCTAYENGTPTWYSSDPSCLYPVNEYLWLNNLHPTFPIHNATAASVVKTLNAGVKTD
ncbi:hypothetical protein BU23DRAFT_294399 [Bimuria novae-zelandiae CBS 107.79]|uniref:Carbohydrate esterase family 16 protein n=1 Tax=Bimuria novae-zelandiae CBS 107.79 TaxID=1447943 RepID=A0A6A5VKY0_9PLEO|nr:hypothetical protein BU23DRAFT_294399 [Bimuria novae-zelandiae CBS 107.79]